MKKTDFLKTAYGEVKSTKMEREINLEKHQKGTPVRQHPWGGYGRTYGKRIAG